MLKLLIATDGSAHAGRAIDAAARLARRVPNTRAVLLNVRERPACCDEMATFSCSAVAKALRESQGNLLADAAARARAVGLVSVVTEAAIGVAAVEIARAASSHAVNQIVIGTHGNHALDGLLLGSVAQRVLHLVDVPVLMVK